MEAFIQNLDLPVCKIRPIVDHMLRTMQSCLKGEPGSLLMIPGYTDIPSGKESGFFLAIDFGGTNLRCILLKVTLNKVVDSRQRSMELDPKTETAEKLFSTIAQFIVDFLAENTIFMGKTPSVLNAGFTFSFPIQQNGISSGSLIYWTKEFIATGVVGNDVVELLHEQLKKLNHEWVKIVALCNDTVGTLCAATTTNPKTQIGVILGTGTNACYREKVKNITKLGPEAEKKHGEYMVINMEWGAYDGFPYTPEDDAVNHETRKQGTARMEKMVSGRYLPMITRKCLNRCIENGWVLSNLDLENYRWDAKEELTAVEIEIIEYDSTPQLTATRDFICKFGQIPDSDKDKITYHELLLIRSLFHAIVVRSARFAAVALATVVMHIVTQNQSLPEIEVAIDGSIYHKHKGYKEELQRFLTESLNSLPLGPTPPLVRCVPTKDGSGLGAGIIAAVQTNL
ncbi:Hexokinase [Blattamonas nauphoetae]|uniref:Phosphotransferase n=1 Tax=Blattamonas nauphoetae TaxID=2049346 RepID=A0ABQ9YMS6_9EUKA|nr:Hexokinase [Blattamonas nauphoetae]